MTPKDYKALIAELEEGIIDPTQPNLIGGSNIAQGRMKDIPPERAGSGFCSMAHWQAENDDFECRPCVEFGKFGARIGYNFYNWNEEVIYTEPFKAMRGTTQEGDVAISVHAALLQIQSRLVANAIKRRGERKA